MSDRTEALDPLAILAAIGIDDVRSAERITTGLGGAALFRVERAADRSALRVFRSGGHVLARREEAAMAVARAGGLPVPRIEAQGAWNDRPVMLTDWCDGETMLDDLGRRPWRAYAIGRVLGRTQARLHAATPPAGSPLGVDWIERFGQVEPRLRQRLEAAAGRTALIHLDLHPVNVLIVGNRVTGVIDWENAMIGDPRADLARTWSLLRLAPMPPEARRPGVALIRRVLERGWRRGYRETAGWPEELDIFLAWAAEAQILDLAPKIGGPGVWLRPEDLEPIRRAAHDLRARAGLPG